MNLDPTLLANKWLWFAGGATGLMFLIKIGAEVAAARNGYSAKKAAVGIEKELRLIREELQRHNTTKRLKKYK